jgi:hypothetical protein
VNDILSKILAWLILWLVVPAFVVFLKPEFDSRARKQKLRPGTGRNILIVVLIVWGVMMYLPIFQPFSGPKVVYLFGGLGFSYAFWQVWYIWMRTEEPPPSPEKRMGVILLGAFVLVFVLVVALGAIVWPDLTAGFVLCFIFSMVVWPVLLYWFWVSWCTWTKLGKGPTYYRPTRKSKIKPRQNLPARRSSTKRRVRT